jgi:chorismate mutase/prephenate dehydratase
MEKEIKELRKKIDAIDKQLIAILRQRTNLSLKIGQIKRKNGKAIFDPGREKVIIDALKKKVQGPITPAMIEEVYSTIFSISRSLQEKKKVAYLGPIGTYSFQAADKVFRYDATLLAMPTIEDVFQEVSSSRADLGVVPVENSTEGMVTQTLDLIASSSVYISKEVMLPIRNALLGKGSVEKIKKVYSHQQPIAQCRHWLRENLPNVTIIETKSTADAALMAKKDKTCAAIASEFTAQYYGLNILVSNINDYPNNTTRFWIVSKNMASPSGHDKTSFIVTLDNSPGALYKALGAFAKQSINLTKIESRPSKKSTWEYIFFVDIQGNLKDKAVKQAVAELKAYTRDIIVLGSYPEGEILN